MTDTRKALVELCEMIVRDVVPATASGATCFVPRYQIDQLREALAADALQGGGCPEGWVLVPKVPTHEMLRAAAKHDYYGERDPTWRSLYANMLSAAPSPPAPTTAAGDL